MRVIDESTESGKRAAQRLRDEVMIWLTTVRPDGQPQTSPVWFLWDGESFLIFSQPDTQKVRNVNRHPRVSLHLDGNGKGGDVVTIEGSAAAEQDAPTADSIEEFVTKYGDHIAAMQETPESLARSYSTAIRVTPSRARYW